jgi:hypothetical protein
MIGDIVRVSEPEIWKDVPDFVDKYQVSNLGRIRSKRTAKSNFKIMVPVNMKGYSRIKLLKSGISKSVLLHRLILISFNGEDENKRFVNHKNGIRNDNRLENLEWVTPSENVKHGFDVLGRTMTFIKPISQLSIDGKILKEWSSIMDASKSLGISHSSISQCCNGSGVRKTCGGFKWKFINK